MHILVAPNAFKNSLEATGVAKAIIKGLKQSKLKCITTAFPVGDGGDGTGSLIIKHLKGKIIRTKVRNPIGKQINSSFGLIENGTTAVIEMADASGLRLLKQSEYDPLHASSAGTGQLIAKALDKGVKKIILCIGGSATVDGGTGILNALGYRFLDKKHIEIKQLPVKLTELEYIDFSSVDKRLKTCQFFILCDVQNKLLGKQGAAAVFGPQKGASANDIKKLEAGLRRFKEIVLKQFGKDISEIKHGGAAGGVAAGLYGLLGAKLVNGIDHFLSLTGFGKVLKKADLVITGEGSIDEQTLDGKGPFGVAKKAKEKKLYVIGLAGKIPLQSSTSLKRYFDLLTSINHQPTTIEEAIKNTENNLVRTARVIGDSLLLQRISL